MGRGVVGGVRGGRVERRRRVGERGAGEGAKTTREARMVEHTQAIASKGVGSVSAGRHPLEGERARKNTQKCNARVEKGGGGRAEGPDYRRFLK